MGLRLLTLGTVRCFRGEAEITELPGQPLRCAVLVHLAVEREVTRESLASLLWPERESERARHALNQKLYELRQVLGDAWIESQSEPMRVTPALRVDALEFEAAAEAGRLEEALAAYDGAFLGDFYVRGSAGFEHWADGHRARLARLHRTVRRAFIQQCVSRGDLERAIAQARRWVEIDPSEDEAHHRLIELLADAGDRAGAIRQYQSYKTALEVHELEPLDHIRELIERVRRSRATPDPPAPLSSPTPPPHPSGDAPDPASAAAPSSRPDGEGGRRSRPRLAALALAVALVLGSGGWWTANRLLGGSEPPPRTIAVLPFLDLGPDPGVNEPLSDGIAEELIHALTRIDSLQVAARTSSFRFRGREVDVRSLGDSLDVGLVVEGSVRQEGDLLRVTAQLISVADGYHLWSRTFDRELGDVLALQEEIASAIVDVLRITLETPERARLAVGGTDDPRAYEQFLHGRYLLQQGTRTAVRSAIRHLDSAVVLDPGYALAHAELAQAYVRAAARADLPRAEALGSAKSLAAHAIRLEPSLPEAHAALGRAELELWNWSAAEREARLAIRLHPENSSARETYTGVLMVRGRGEEAVREAARAAELEPLSAAAARNHAEALHAARRFEEAVRVYRRALELEPALGRQSLAKTYLELGMYDSARVSFRTAAAVRAPRFPAVQLLWDAYTHAREGDRDRAFPLLRRFESREPEGANAAYLLAAAHMALGDTARALELLEGGIGESRQPAWRQLPWDPVWDPLRGDPRFAVLLERMSL